jgi:Glycosyl transferase family 2
VKIGLVTTVKNEQALLRRNLLYHQYLGVDECYVYADDPGDGTIETVADLPFVRARTTVPADRFREHPQLAAEISQYQYVPSRQVLNVFDAMAEARSAGVDWLFHLDPDELLCLDRQSAERGELRTRLAALDHTVEMVWFEPLEIVQTGAAYQNVFAEAILFKRPVRTIMKSVPDPVSGATVPVPTYYGHVAGKSGVRLSAFARPANPHRFCRMDGSRLSSATLGFVLHYFAYDFDDFYKKLLHMKTQADVFRGGGQRTPQKRLWKAMMNDAQMSREALEAYYRRWVVLSPDDIARWRRRGALFGIPWRPRALVEVPSAARAWRDLG